MLGNEPAHSLSKAGCGGGGILRATEGGVRALWNRLRASERSVSGLGAGKISRWGRRVASRYAQLHPGKGDLGVWRERLGRGLGSCRLCQGALERGVRLVFRCPGTREGIGWQWARWIELDDKTRWVYEYEEAGLMRLGDQVEGFFFWLDRQLCGVG